MVDPKLISKFLGYILSDDRSKFSLSLIDKHFEILSSSLSTELLQDQLSHAIQLSTAWFGKEYAELLKEYIESLQTFTFMEWAAWMGKFGIVGSFLIGGINPCIRSRCKREKDTSHTVMLWNEELIMEGSKVLIRFFDSFPLPLSSYIVKRVIEMRLEAHRMQQQQKDGFICSTCKKSVPQSARLQFASCQHNFCEPCFWRDLLKTIDQKESHEAVVTCPCCPLNDMLETNLESIDWRNLEPKERREESLRMFQALPSNSRALKSKPKKKKKVCLANSWYEAIYPSLGQSQDVRRDKFFSAIERNAVQYVSACLVAGVDMEWRNEYGQTALYICTWRGYTNIVKMLIDFGADLFAVANGGSSIYDIAKLENHSEIMGLFESKEEDDKRITLKKVMQEVNDSSPVLKTLIPLSSNHPGAGSYTLDAALSTAQVESLLELCNRLPLDITQKKKSGFCSDRKYYCDAEGYMCRLLERVVSETGLVMSGDTIISLPFMRFLIYNQIGTTLAPHVDLCRVDDGSGLRSTHTFILYLTTNEDSGETSLLGDVSGEERSNVLAKIVPKRGRLLLFPHACPHEGNEVLDIPKIILRGEIILSSKEIN